MNKHDHSSSYIVKLVPPLKLNLRKKCSKLAQSSCTSMKSDKNVEREEEKILQRCNRNFGFHYNE